MENNHIKNSNITGQFFRYVSLNTLSMIGLSLYILADTYFIANGVGPDGLIALNLVIPVYSFLNGMGLLLGIGGAIRYSISTGGNNAGQGSRLFSQCLLVGFGLGVAMTLVGIFFAGHIATLLGADSTVKPHAEAYLRTLLSFSCPFIANNILVCFVRNDANPALAMASMLTSSTSNMILDYIFIYPCGLGMFGASLATGLAPLMSMAVLSLHFICKKNRFHLVKFKLRLHEIKQIFLAGIPSFITELSSGIVIMLFNFVILDLAGNTGVGAYGIVTNTMLVAVSIFSGIGQGVQPLIGNAYGAGKRKTYLKLLRLGFIVSFAVSIIIYISALVGAPAIAAAFNKELDPLLQQYAERGLRLYFSSFLLAGFNIIGVSYFACTEKSKSALAVSMLRGFALVIPCLFILSSLLGMDGVWLTMTCTEALTLAVVVLLLLRKKKPSSPIAEKVQ